MILVFFAIFSLCAAIVTALLARLSEIELPDSSRRMRSGGLFIWTSAGLALVAIRFMILSPEVRVPIDATVQALAIMVLVGLADDLFDLSWRKKFVGQVVCLIPLALSFASLVPHASTGILLTLGVVVSIWLLLVTNGTNLMDGIDGYTGTWSLLTLAGLLFVTYQSGASIPLAAVAALAIGPLVLFVIYNRSPARVFLGDTGSLSFGFLTGLLGLLLLLLRPDLSRLLALLVVMTLPIFEVLTTICRRLVSRRGVFQSDVDHIHHRLVAVVGGSVNRAADILSATQVVILMVAYTIDEVSVPVAVVGSLALWVCVSIGLIGLSSGFRRTSQTVGALQATEDS